MKKDNNNIIMSMITLLFSIFLIGMVSAGFASSYLPDNENGQKVLYVQPGISEPYFIYPQNLDNQTLYVKVEVTDSNNTLQNSLKDVYEVPANTKGDEFKIELDFQVASNTKMGTEYPIKYTVLSTTEKEPNGMVKFSPVGYEKSFLISVKNLDKQPTPTNYWMWVLWIVVALAVIAVIALSIYAINVMKNKENRQEEKGNQKQQNKKQVIEDDEEEEE